MQQVIRQQQYQQQPEKQQQQQQQQQQTILARTVSGLLVRLLALQRNVSVGVDKNYGILARFTGIPSHCPRARVEFPSSDLMQSQYRGGGVEVVHGQFVPGAHHVSLNLQTLLTSLQILVWLVVLLYVHRNHRLITDRNPGQSPRLSHNS